MVKGIIPNASIVGDLKRLAGNFRHVVQAKVGQIIGDKTCSPGGISGPLANVYRDQVIFGGSLPQLMALFDRFAYKKLTQWKQTNSQTIANATGTTVLLQYQASRHFNVALAPVTGWARAKEGMEAHDNPRYDRCKEKISYEYLCDFGFDGQGGHVVVNYVTTETIDSDGGAKRDLTTHYRAPQLPREFGDIGGLFIAGLRARGLI